MIAVNDAYTLAPWADVLYACDGHWVKWHQGVKGFTGLKYSLTVDRSKWPEWRQVRHDPSVKGQSGLSLDPTRLQTGRNSGYQAINLAVLFGASKIVLLGYDMSRDPAQRKSHFFGEHPKRPKPSPYSQFLQLFPSLVKPLRRAGVEVINCTRRTALTTFQQMRLEDALVGEMAVAG